MSLVSWQTPWKPATIAIAPSSSAFWMRPGRDVDDLGLAVGAVGDDAGLAAGERPGLLAEVADRHREQRHRDALARGQQHVELAARRAAGETCWARSMQLVGGVAHRGDHDDDVVAGPLGVDDPLGDPLDAVGVGDGGAAVLLHDDAHGTPRGRSDLADAPRSYRRPRVPRRRDGCRDALSGRRAGLVGRRDLVLLALELGVEPVVGDHGLQRAQHGAGLGAPGGDVGELPPPQRLADAAGAVVPQAVGEGGGDAGQVVGQQRGDELGRVDVGVEHLAVGVDALEQHRQPQPHRVEVGVGAGVGLVLVGRGGSRCARRAGRRRAAPG